MLENEWNGAKKDLACKVAEFIHLHYTEKFSLKRIASELYVDKCHIDRTFKSVTGLTPRQYQNQFRCEEAMLMLEKTSHRISEIALKTGFDSASYFRKVFKRHIGMTPDSFRKYAEKL